MSRSKHKEYLSCLLNGQIAPAHLNRDMRNFLSSYIIIIIIIIIVVFVAVSCHRPILPGNSLEPTVIPTAQASSFTLQYFPYYV
jgi:hypothetical protein